MPQEIREPKHAATQPAPIIPILAWLLVALAMFLAALVLVAGLAGQIAANDRPPPTDHSWITPGPDTITPPLLERPCDPIFQRCEVPA